MELKENKMSQSKVILKHLESGKEITQLEATQKYGILRLGAIIFNLRKDGYRIMSRREHNPNRYGNVSNYAIYKLIKEN